MNRNGNGTKYGARNPTMVKSTSPAKMFPNSLNENEIILTNSEINSSNPAKERIGFLRVKNLEKYFLKPRAVVPKNCTPIMTMDASAIVKLRSAAGALKRGTVDASWLIKTLPTPGRSPSQLEIQINKKTVVTTGKYFKESARSPKTESMSFKTSSNKSSKNP